MTALRRFAAEADGQAWAAVALTLGCLLAAGFAVAGLIADGGLGPTLAVGKAVAVAAAAAGVADLALRLYRSVSASGGRAVQFHAHGITPRVVARHEAGHVEAILRAGGRVTEVRTGPGWGVTRGYVPADIDPIDDAAIDYAGGAAARTQSGCSSDHSSARRRIASAVPWTLWGGERDAAHRQAQRRAEQWVGPVFLNGRVRRVADEIERTGRY